jgi:cytochrome c556
MALSKITEEGSMRRVLTCTTILLAMAAGSAMFAQGKISTVEDYDKAMKAIGGAFGGVAKAVQGGSMAEAKTGLATARTQMVAVQAFWVEKKKDDPAAIAKDSISKMDALDKALGGTDSAAAMAAFKEVGGTCQACHMKYRDPDPANPKSFVMKPGVL